MANRSSDFLEVVDDPHHTPPHLQRSRSGGYADYLEEKTRWDRRDRERHMKRYHDAHLSPTDAAPPSASANLYVPAFEPAHRRSRSHEHIEVRAGEPARTYRVREAVPARLSGASESAWMERGTGAGEIVRTESQKKKEKGRSRRPSIKVQIHQDTPPRPQPASATSRRTPNRSPGASASPHSPNAVPQLEFQVATLLSRLRSVGATCAPWEDVEAARPRDLTFAQIAERCKGFGFEVEVWSRVVRIEEMGRIDARKRLVVETAAKTLERLTERALALGEVCKGLRPADLRVELVPEVESDDEEGSGASDDEYEDEDGDRNLDAVFESPAFIVQEHLNSIQMQIQTLKRLTRSLQEATPAAEDEVVAVERIVADVGRQCDSEGKLGRHATYVY